jgi:hypothetical protein
MDPDRFKDAYARLELLDDRLTFRIREKSVRARGIASVESLDERVRDASEFLLELKEIVRELMLAIANKPGSRGED